MYIPCITSIENALKIYYENAEMGNKEIKCLFGNRSSATISRLKKLVRAEMIKRSVPTFNAYKVNTVIAYDAWGIDINDLENRRNKIKELALDTNFALQNTRYLLYNNHTRVSRQKEDNLCLYIR